MTWTKRQIIEAAYNELALADYVFDLTPEELQAAAVRLDAQMAMWAAQGLDVSYVFGLGPEDADLNQTSGVPLVYIEAVYMQLAVRTAASKGKQLARSTMKAAKDAMDVVYAHIVALNTREQQYRHALPRGAGNSPHINGPFFPEPETNAAGIAPDGGLEFLGN